MPIKSQPIIISFSICLLLAATHARAQEQQGHPADHWEIAAELGYLTKIKHNSPLNYVIAPAQLAWRSPAAFDLWNGDSGVRLTVRNRLALVAETFIKGPEDYYVAFAAAPSIELWSADQKNALFYEIGGGVGLTNAKHVEGGQGQNLAFNWFTQLGLRRQINQKLAITVGRYFTHHSNRGMTNPNPGIDVIGYNVGLVWQFDK